MSDEEDPYVCSKSTTTRRKELVLTDRVRIPLPTTCTTDEGHDEFGCKLWTAAVLLCGVLRSNPHLIRGKTVLEIGAGLGACGFCCAALGAAHTTITDCGPQTLNQLDRLLVEYQNAVISATATTTIAAITVASTTSATTTVRDSSILIKRHLWEEDLEFVEARLEGRPMDTIHHWSKIGGPAHPSLSFDDSFDVIVGSDLLYFSTQERPLLAAIKLRLRQQSNCSNPTNAAPPPVALILQTMRTNNISVFERFIHCARQDSFQVDVQDIRPEDIPDPLVHQQTFVSETKHTIGYKLVTLRHLVSS